MRQTKLSFNELVSELNVPRLGLARCLVINEIGEICAAENHKGAETILRQLLNNGDPRDKLLAYCWLSILEDKDDLLLIELKEFEEKPENKTIVERAKESIKAWKRREENGNQ